jgi:pre-mRNA branch site protein p14
MTHLNGFHLMERYIVGMSRHQSRSWAAITPLIDFSLTFIFVFEPLVLYHHPPKAAAAALAKAELKAREDALADEKKKLGMTD